MLTFSVNLNINDVIATKEYLTETKPTTEYGRAWWSEVWIKAIDDKVDETVNIDAYGYVCERNTKMAIASKEVPLLSVEEIENGLRGVSDTVASYQEARFEVVVEESEAKSLVDEFLEAQYFISSSEGVDLWSVLDLARKSNVQMLDKLRELIKRYSLENLIEGVLRNRDCIKVLESVMM